MSGIDIKAYDKLNKRMSDVLIINFPAHQVLTSDGWRSFEEVELMQYVNPKTGNKRIKTVKNIGLVKS